MQAAVIEDKLTINQKVLHFTGKCYLCKKEVIMIKKIFIGCLLFGCLFHLSAQTDDNTLAKLALQYYSGQEYDKAAESYARLYANTPNHYYYTYYFQSLIKIKDYKAAEKLVHKQLKTKYTMWEYQVDLGYVFELQNETNKAKKQYEACIDALLVNSSDVVDLARAFLNRGKKEYAVKTYLKGRKLSGKEVAYAMDIAVIYENQGLYGQASQEYFDLLNAEPDKLSNVESVLLSWWLNDDNNEKKDILRSQILKYGSRYPDNRVYSDLLIWYAVQEKDFSMALKHVKAMDRKYNLAGYTVLNVANTALRNGDYAAAEDGYKYIISLGNKTVLAKQAQAALLDVQLSRLQTPSGWNAAKAEMTDKELRQYFQQYNVTDKNAELYRKWIRFKALCLRQVDTAAAMLMQQIALGKLPPQQITLLKVDLAQLKVLQGDVWEAILLNAQVEKSMPNDTIAQVAKFTNAKISLMQGETEWAEAQLEVLSAATSKLIANDAMYLALLIRDNKSEEDSLCVPLQYFAKAMFLTELNWYDQAEIMLDSVSMAKDYKLNDDVLYYQAMIAKYRGEYAKADSLLEVFLLNYSTELLADDALYERALLQEQYLKNPVSAMDLYQQLLTYHSDSIYAVEARNHIHALRSNMQRQTE